MTEEALIVVEIEITTVGVSEAAIAVPEK